MSNLTYYAYPGVGEYALEHMSYSQAVRVGDRIECSGQGGWTAEGGIPASLDDEIDQAFKNVEINLLHAGGKGWDQVFRVTSYHKDIKASHAKFVENLRKWMPKHKAIWTEIGVTQLGLDEMNIEIEVVAFDPQETKAEA